MTTLAEIATVLETTEKNVLVRAAKLRILPVCGRCIGSGQYSFNGSHSICYGCNGSGARVPKASELPEVLAAAIETKRNGKFAEYMLFLESIRATKNATDQVMAAWKASGISEAYDWRKAYGAGMVQRDADISAINKKMAEAFDSVLHFKLNSKSATYQADMIRFAETLKAALKTVESATQEFKEYLKNN